MRTLPLSFGYYVTAELGALLSVDPREMLDRHTSAVITFVVVAAILATWQLSIRRKM